MVVYELWVKEISGHGYHFEASKPTYLLSTDESTFTPEPGMIPIHLCLHEHAHTSTNAYKHHSYLVKVIE
jgi:hypothetical protein